MNLKLISNSLKRYTAPVRREIPSRHIPYFLLYYLIMYTWQKAKIIKIFQSASDMKSIFVVPENFFNFKAGQHCEICLPGENVIRKYSIVSPTQEKNYLEFGVQLIQNGALSPKLWNLNVGDEVEIRGPIGQAFVWEESNPAPIVLIGSGSGITPLLSIYYSYKKKYSEGECLFILSAKDSSRVMNYDLLKNVLITRFTAKEGRIDLEFLKNNLGELVKNKNTLCYICGPDNFIDDMMDYALELGIPEENIKSERFI